MTLLVRRCPQGHERPLSEAFCEALLADGSRCQFPLLDLLPVPVTPHSHSGVSEPDQDPLEPLPPDENPSPPAWPPGAVMPEWPCRRRG